jgi:hypothetical protein
VTVFGRDAYGERHDPAKWRDFCGAMARFSELEDSMAEGRVWSEPVSGTYFPVEQEKYRDSSDPKAALGTSPSK